jgi:hypothetical protein
MSFYLWVSLALFGLVAYDLVTGKVNWSNRGLFTRSGATRRGDPTHYWLGILWRTAVALALAALAFFHVAEPK